MKTYIFSFFILLIALCNHSCNNSLKADFRFLEGRWKMPLEDSAYIMEEWHQINKDHFSAEVAIIRKDSITPNEKIVLQKRNNKYYYTPQVFGQNGDKPIDFELVSVKDNKYIFENIEHDFPQRIWYKKINANTLQAGISGAQGEKEQTFVYEKAE